MGLLDLFSKDKRDERNRSKNIERALNKYAQSGDRIRALELLLEDGSDEALYGLLRRFGMTYDKSIEDEQEKEWVFEELCGKGAAALAPVQRYLVAAESISWPLRILDKVASPDEHVAALEQVLARHEPGYERDPSKKIQILGHLGGFAHPKSSQLLVPYLEDMDEGVRFASSEALLRQKEEAVARVPLLTLFANDKEESKRIRLLIAEGFITLGWSAQSHREGVLKHMPAEFTLDKSGSFAKRQ